MIRVLFLQIVNPEENKNNIEKYKISAINLNEISDHYHKDSGFDIYTPSHANTGSRYNDGKTMKIKLGLKCAAYNFKIKDVEKYDLITQYFTIANNKQDSQEEKQKKLTDFILANMSNGDIIPQAYQLYARSSIGKTPYRLANNVGIIDSGYRGELCALVDSIEGPLKNFCETGDRLFQICMPDLTPFRVLIVDALDNTERGGGGFGSTGK